MKLMLKYLKKTWKSVLLIITLLIVQAICDLSLPSYTSDIINVGVQQGGINSTTFKVMKESTFDQLSLFINEEDLKKLNDSYKLITKDNEEYVKKYPLLKTENLYILKNNDKLDDILTKPILVSYMLTSDTEEALLIQNKIKENLPDFLKEYSVIDIIKNTDNKEMLNKINKAFDSYPESIIEQAAISRVKTEYKEIGLNTDKIQTNYVLISGIKMLSVAIIAMIASIGVGYLGAKCAAFLAKNLRLDVFKKAVSFSTTEYKAFTTSSLITRTTNDIQQVQMFLVFMLRVIFYAPIVGIGGVIKVLNTNTTMAWILALAVMVILGIIILLFALVMPKFKIVQKLIDKLNLVTREIITGIPVIRAFSNQKKEEERFRKANNNLKKTTLFVDRAMSIMMPSMMFVMNSICILIVWKGSHSINDGVMQVGDMLAFIQYTMQIIGAFLMVSMFSIMMPRAGVSIGRINEVLKCDPVIKDPVNPKTFSKRIKGLIEFKNVSFRYPDSDEDVLTDITFKAEPGKITAFIGSTGSGKSTLINLIPRLFDATKGEILVDGINVKDVTQKDLHSKIGFVPQKGVLFSGTIKSNICYGKKDATLEEIERSARIAQATSFILEKKDGYNYKIAQGGTNVSGGQKQRLSIARAITTNPEIYIFDDSFSALDFKTDANLRKALFKETKDSTILIVAQRISTILNADQIIVLDEGKIVGIGSHKELMKKCSIYKEIATSQLSKEELENA